MPERQNPSKSVRCAYCGETNIVPLSLLELDFEGNNPSTRLQSQRARGKAPGFTCKWCKRKNSLDNR